MYIIIILTAILALLTFQWLKRPFNFPPGPCGFPVLGIIPITKDKTHLVCSSLVPKYGPIIGAKFATHWCVLLHDTKMIREVFAATAAAGRLATEASSFIAGDEFGILQASGDFWTEQRRLSMRILRDFGFGKASMEEMILEEAQDLFDWLKKQAGKPVQLKRRFSLAVINSLWRIITGERYEHDDEALVDILEKLESTQRELKDIRSIIKLPMLYFYPKVAKYFGNFSGWLRLTKMSQSRMALFDRIIKEHSESLDTESPRDFVDVYLKEVNNNNQRRPSSNFETRMGKHSLRSVITDLFIAGSDTTSVTLLWTILYLLHYPEIQKKMQQELDSVLRTRQPTLNDRKSLPYLECVIMEVYRCSSIIPLGVSHLTMQDLKISGYDIPKETIINANIFHVHNDPAIWGDPEIFRPERFLNPDGTCVGRHESLMPFSVGRRACMGENLARDTIFIFVSLLLQNFTIMQHSNTNEKPSLQAVTGLVALQPKPFSVKMEVRL